MKVDLLELADRGSPERLVGSILQSNPDLDIPVSIEALAAAVGIGEIQRIATTGFEGSLVTNPEKSAGAIALNVASPRQRQRFTIAHEIGHFLIPTHTGDIRCASSDMSVFGESGGASVRREAEANRFASGILMPAPYFRRDVERLGDPDLAHIFSLADRYDTSLEATANRHVDFTTYACAFVFSHNGRVRYWRSSEGFPWLDVKGGSALPDGSLSACSAALEYRVPSEWSEAPGEVWLATSRQGKRLPAILEQVVKLSGGYRITLLQIEGIDEGEEEDEEADLEKSWEVRFRRK